MAVFRYFSSHEKKEINQLGRVTYEHIRIYPMPPGFGGSGTGTAAGTLPGNPGIFNRQCQ